MKTARETPDTKPGPRQDKVVMLAAYVAEKQRRKDAELYKLILARVKHLEGVLF